jgi:hypothetical protein
MPHSPNSPQSAKPTTASTTDVRATMARTSKPPRRGAACAFHRVTHIKPAAPWGGELPDDSPDSRRTLNDSEVLYDTSETHRPGVLPGWGRSSIHRSAADRLIVRHEKPAHVRFTVQRTSMSHGGRNLGAEVETRVRPAVGQTSKSQGFQSEPRTRAGLRRCTANLGIAAVSVGEKGARSLPTNRWSPPEALWARAVADQ